jgi:hypothetical protein
VRHPREGRSVPRAAVVIASTSRQSPASQPGGYASGCAWSLRHCAPRSPLPSPSDALNRDMAVFANRPTPSSPSASAVGGASFARRPVPGVVARVILIRPYSRDAACAHRRWFSSRSGAPASTATFMQPWHPVSAQSATRYVDEYDSIPWIHTEGAESPTRCARPQRFGAVNGGRSARRATEGAAKPGRAARRKVVCGIPRAGPGVGTAAHRRRVRTPEADGAPTAARRCLTHSQMIPARCSGVKE